MYQAILAAVALALATATAGSAASMYFFFAGDPFSIANLPREERPLFTTGELTIDTTRLESDLAGATLTGSYDFEQDRPNWSPAVSGFRFSTIPDSLRFWDFSVSFDGNREIADWNFRQEDAIGTTVSIRSGGTTGLVSPHYYGHFLDYPPAWSVAEDLELLGYRPGTPDFERLAAEWEGDSLYEWRSEGPGRWFTDALAFARQVEENTRSALADPARSFNDIPPFLEPVPGAGPVPVVGGEPSPVAVPVPAPLALMLGVLGLLGLGSWRRTASRA